MTPPGTDRVAPSAGADRLSPVPTDDQVQAAHAAALAGLPGMGPAGLVAVLRDRSPLEAWADVRAGRIERPAGRSKAAGREQPDPAGGEQSGLFGSAPGPAPHGRAAREATWAQIAGRIDPVSWWSPSRAAGIRVTWMGHPAYPPALIDDPQPPGVLFWRGRSDALDRPCVAVVGTRSATPDGRAVAYEMGRDLAAAGVCVVSGLALGIDGAAHAGALDAVRAGAPGTTVGIAASGVDVPYPRRHAGLWRDVVQSGAVFSENLPGRPAQAWRFPSRNRVIAGLVSMVVVVESHTCGGSLITAEAAMERGVEVRVVPGPVHSPASAGSNQLLYDGPGPVRHARDVLDALGIVLPEPAAAAPAPAARSALDPVGGRVLEAMGWRPVSTGQIMARTGIDAAGAQGALDRLVASRYVVEQAGWWVRVR